MPRSTAARITVRGLALVVLAGAAAAVSNALAGPERRLEWVRSEAAPVSSAGASAPKAAGGPAPAGAAATAPAAGANPWKEVSTDEAEGFFRSGTLFLDARRTAEYRQGHIRNARSVPVWEAGLDDKIKALFQELPDQTIPIVVYCNGGECEDSHELAQKLYLAGFDGVRVYRDGFPDWSKRKLPVSTGDAP